MDAQDWPPKQIVFDMIYLLQVNDDEAGDSWKSTAIPVYISNLQFQWITKGTDVSNYNDVEGRNRGDRVRTAWQIKEEILKALYPGFAQKQELSVEGTQIVSQTLNEPVIWTRPQIRIRVDKESGLSYGIALVRLLNMTQEIES